MRVEVIYTSEGSKFYIIEEELYTLKDGKLKKIEDYHINEKTGKLTIGLGLVK